VIDISCQKLEVDSQVVHPVRAYLWCWDYTSVRSSPQQDSDPPPTHPSGRLTCSWPPDMPGWHC